MGVRWGSCMWCACEGEVIHHGETSEEMRRTAGKVNVSPAMSEAHIYFTFKSQPTMPSGLTATSFPPSPRSDGWVELFHFPGHSNTILSQLNSHKESQINSPLLANCCLPTVNIILYLWTVCVNPMDPLMGRDNCMYFFPVCITFVKWDIFSLMFLQ